MPVAMVAVMKAGGASIALDYTQPGAEAPQHYAASKSNYYTNLTANESLAHSLTAGPVAIFDERLIDRLTLNAGQILAMV